MANYNVTWWMYSGKKDDYDNHDENTEAISPKNAELKMKQKYPRGKNFKATLL